MARSKSLDESEIRLVELLKEYNQLLRSQCNRLMELRSQRNSFSFLTAGLTTILVTTLPLIAILDQKAKTMDLIGRPYTYILILIMMSVAGVIFLFNFSLKLKSLLSQISSAKAETVRIVPRFQKLVSYLFQLEDQGAINREARIELDLRLVEAEAVLLLVKEVASSSEAKSMLMNEQTEILRKKSLNIASKIENIVAEARKGLDILQQGGTLHYAKDAASVREQWINMFKERWHRAAQSVDAELSERLPKERGIPSDLLRSPKELEDLEQIAANIGLRAMQLPRSEYTQENEEIALMDLRYKVYAAKAPAEQAKRREVIMLLERNIEEARRGERLTDTSLLLTWLNELQEIQTSH